MGENIIVGLINSITGVMFILFCIPLIKRRVKMNDLYGFRMSQAFKSEQNWFDINEYGARKTLGWSIFTLLSGIVAFFINFKDDSMLSLLWVVGPITLTAVVPIVQTFKYSKRL